MTSKIRSATTAAKDRKRKAEAAAREKGNAQKYFERTLMFTEPDAAIYDAYLGLVLSLNPDLADKVAADAQVLQSNSDVSHMLIDVIKTNSDYRKYVSASRKAPEAVRQAGQAKP